MPDEIARLSDAVARDPAGLAWVALADALRRARRLPEAERTALRGLERHPYHADGHDVLARVYADRGDTSRARDEWEMTLQLRPGHVSALLGLGWLALRAGDRATAQRRWEAAREAAPGDPRVAAAAGQLQLPAATPPEAMQAPRTAMPAAIPAAPAPRATMAAWVEPAAFAAAPGRRPTPASATPSRALPRLFAGLEHGGVLFVLLADADGFVLAGEARDAAGRDRSDELAAELAGMSGDAARALRQLHIGAWERVQVECEGATLALAPGEGDTVTLVAADARTPAGVPRRLLDRARRQAAAWLASL